MSAILGERVVVTHDLPSGPQVVEVVEVAQVNKSVPGLGGAAEFWHWDSISYVGNFLLNPMEDMEGGELEMIK